MGPIEAVQTVMVKYFTFRGRAPRSEYWWFMLFYSALVLAAGAADGQKLYTALSAETLSFDTRVAAYWTPWVMLGLFVPYHTVSVRRLHDIGLSGFWMLALIYGPAVAYPFVMIGAVANQFAALDAGTVGQAASMIVGYQVVSVLCALTFAVMMMWPTQRADNRHGPGPYEHHEVGGANFMAAGSAASGAAASPGAVPKPTHNPWAGYASLGASTRPRTEQEAAAHRDEIRALYRRKILGEADPAETEQPRA
ncbi:MAG: DUF805 domain-containing protein [Roseivivax sp.]|nr:DUF805 domain-containing protein [Roseivivax sp.]